MQIINDYKFLLYTNYCISKTKVKMKKYLKNAIARNLQKEEKLISIFHTTNSVVIFLLKKKQ
jgi:hypothetical protein